jgi:hypothetical protein
MIHRNSIRLNTVINLKSIEDKKIIDSKSENVNSYRSDKISEN